MNSENTTLLVKAVNLALDNKWDQAHHIVQEYDDSYACWIHAVLHKIEGDEGNSKYWYRQAGRDFSSATADDELRQILQELS